MGNISSPLISITHTLFITAKQLPFHFLVAIRISFIIGSAAANTVVFIVRLSIGDSLLCKAHACVLKSLKNSVV